MNDQEILDAIVSRNVDFRVENENVPSIKKYAFSHCPHLPSFSFPQIKFIQQYAFFYCIGLTKIIIPPTCTQIQSYAFSNCSNLKTIEILGSSLPNGTGYNFNATRVIELILRSETVVKYDNWTDYNSTRLSGVFGRIYVPDDLVDDYYSTGNWPSSAKFVGLSQYPVTEFGTITDSWETILAAENDGTYLTKYSLGDTKSVFFNGRYIILKIIAFDTDNLSDGSGKAHITWMSTTSEFEARMFDRSSASNNRSWDVSLCRSKIRDLFDECANDFKNAVKEVVKTYRKPDGSTDEISDTIFIPSARELGDVDNKEAYGIIYSYFDTPSSRKLETLKNYWTRSAMSSSSYYYVFSSSGVIYNNSGDTGMGVVPCFCT